MVGWKVSPGRARESPQRASLAAFASPTLLCRRAPRFCKLTDQMTNEPCGRTALRAVVILQRIAVNVVARPPQPSIAPFIPFARPISMPRRRVTSVSSLKERGGVFKGDMIADECLAKRLDQGFLSCSATSSRECLAGHAQASQCLPRGPGTTTIHGGRPPAIRDARQRYSAETRGIAVPSDRTGCAGILPAGGGGG